MTKQTDKTPTTVHCPSCQTTIEWTTKNPHRPFCSERCRNTDFMAWANEENAMAGNPTYDDLLSEDLMISTHQHSFSED